MSAMAMSPNGGSVIGRTRSSSQRCWPLDDQIEFLSQRSGMPRDELLAKLSEHRSATTDELTSEGDAPTAGYNWT